MGRIPGWLQDMPCASISQGGVQGIHAMPTTRAQKQDCLPGSQDCSGTHEDLTLMFGSRKTIKRSDQDQINIQGLLPLLHGSGAELSRRAIVPDRNEDQKEWRQSN